MIRWTNAVWLVSSAEPSLFADVRVMHPTVADYRSWAKVDLCDALPWTRTTIAAAMNEPQDRAIDFYLEFLAAKGIGSLDDEGMWHGESCGLWRVEDDAWAETSRPARPPYGTIFSSDWYVPNDQFPANTPLAVAGQSIRSWKDYYAARQLPSESLVALLLHFPLSLYYALTSLVPPRSLDAHGARGIDQTKLGSGYRPDEAWFVYAP